MQRVNVKDCVSTVSLELGISQRPVTAAVGSTDQDVAQLTALLSSVADEVLLEQPYCDVLGDGYWLSTLQGEMLDRPMHDDDVILFDGRLAIDGLKMRFLQAKGLEFGEAMRDFTSRLNKLAAKRNAVVIDLYEDEGRIQ
jgi:hypothetical protein